ncbi:hypothetical protein B0H19DRAFT_1067741 [Mycena capillaripes]|nr:hypothetical protein B0H19DRAFT_1067741 [Mycena capillaripes]
MTQSEPMVLNIHQEKANLLWTYTQFAKDCVGPGKVCLGACVTPKLSYTETYAILDKLSVVAPVFNPESIALPAVILGVDSQGRTTYAIEQDEIDARTLVEGADQTIVLGFDCDLKDGNTICFDTDSNSQPVTATIPPTSLVLAVVSTAAPSASMKHAIRPMKHPIRKFFRKRVIRRKRVIQSDMLIQSDMSIQSTTTRRSEYQHLSSAHS